MTPVETAALLQRGVTMDTIYALRRAGITTMQQLADRDRGQLADIPNVGEQRAATVIHAIDELTDPRRQGAVRHSPR